MKKLFSVLKYTKNYKGYTALNIFFNILFAVFSAATLALIAPFIDLLFKNDDPALGLILLNGPPDFSLSTSVSTYFQQLISYYLAALIVQAGKAKALMLICIAVVILTFIKNLSRYMAMFFIAPIRNGVVRDLRNKMYR